MALADKTLVCRDCGQQFTWTGSEQQFYADKGFANEPSRCATCRQAHKVNRNTGFGGPRQSYDATCGSCGKPCQVPFQPKGDRPVYCNDCFRNQKQ